MNSEGKVIAQVFTASEAIPVEGATVLVTQRRGDGRSILLGLRESDENGRTTPVIVATPAASLSQSPTEQMSWAVCDITAEHPGYERVVVENVQVFPDTVTLQQFALIPLEERPDLWGKTEVFEVTPQEL